MSLRVKQKRSPDKEIEDLDDNVRAYPERRKEKEYHLGVKVKSHKTNKEMEEERQERLLKPIYHERELEIARIKEETRRREMIRQMNEDKGLARPWLIAGGKTSQYHAGRCSEAFNLLTSPNGMHSVRSIAAYMGIDGNTFSDWQKQYPEFARAVEMARAVREEMAANRLSDGMTYAQGLIFTMKNLYGWADRTENTHTFGLAEALKSVEGQRNAVDWENPKLNSSIDATAIPESVAELDSAIDQIVPMAPEDVT